MRIKLVNNNIRVKSKRLFFTKLSRKTSNYCYEEISHERIYYIEFYKTHNSEWAVIPSLEWKEEQKWIEKRFENSDYEYFLILREKPNKKEIGRLNEMLSSEDTKDVLLALGTIYGMLL